MAHERFGGGECFDIQSDRPNQAAQRLTHGLVVINHENSQVGHICLESKLPGSQSPHSSVAMLLVVLKNKACAIRAGIPRRTGNRCMLDRFLFEW
jgi:hypothetical protein